MNQRKSNFTAVEIFPSRWEYFHRGENIVSLLHGMLFHYFLLVRNKLHLISARCRWSRYATLLPVWRRRQYDVTHGVYWWTWVALWISINLHWSITDKYYVPTNSSMMHITSVRCGIHTVSHNWQVCVSGCYIAINVDVNYLLQRFYRRLRHKVRADIFKKHCRCCILYCVWGCQPVA